MKKNVFKLIGAACVAMVMFSCEEDFLDKEPTGAIRNADQLADAIDLNPDIAGGSVTGIYSTMFTTGTGGTGSQTDFGQKGFDVYGDMLTSDMALSTSQYGWYRAAITEYQAPLDFTQEENYQVWRYYYRVINRSNLVLEGVLGSEIFESESDLLARIAELDQDNQYNVAQAYAMRAHSYFYLTQFMINDVEASWTAETLPIYTEPGLVGNPKSTTEQVYTLMENDLTRAIDLLDGYSRPSKIQINKHVAQTILAYVLASRRDRWEDVATLTGEALSGTSASLMVPDQSTNGILGGFNDVNASGWMWGIDLNTDIGLALVSWWGQIDLFSYSYAAVGDNKAMDAGLYQSMAPDDIRRDQFLNNPTSTRYLQPFNKFYDSDRVVFGTSQVVKADYIYMRYAEVLLLNIEALAKSGQEGPARIQLLNFASQRIGNPAFINGLSGQALLDEIYKQTRLELWGEGKSYLAMKRNMATTERGSNHLSFVGETYDFDEERLTFEIPQQEIQDNLFINTQN